MSIFRKISIGYILAPGFRAADVVGIQAVLGLYPRNKTYFIGETEACVYGKSNFPIVPNTTFDECPHLDVVVIGELPDTALENTMLLDFIKRRVKNARDVIAVSSGVIALGKASLLQGIKATTDRLNMNKLEEFGAVPVNKRMSVVDGKFYTSGPSTGGIESAFRVLRKLRGDFIASVVELTLEYNPHQQFSKSSEGKKRKENKALRPLKVAALTPPYMYVPDVIGAIDVFGSIPGTELYYVWNEKEEAKGILGPRLYADTPFDECPQVDVLLVGAVDPRVSADQDVAKFFVKQAKNASAVISVCAGVFVVGGAGLLKGKKATSNFHMTDLLPQVGAIPSKQEVEVDGKFYSAGPAVGSYEVALLAVRDIYGVELAEHIEQNILEYEPHPVLGMGSPKLAGKVRTAISRALVAPLIPFYKSKAKAGYRMNRGNKDR